MWSEVRERSIFGPKMIKEAKEQVAKVRENLKAAQSRQKELCRYPKKTVRTPTWRFRLLKSITHQGYSEIPSQRKVSPIVYWTISDHWKDRSSSLPLGVTSRNVRHTWCVSRDTTKETSEGTGRTSTYGSHGFTTGLVVSRKTNQDTRYGHPTNQEDRSKILLGTVE